MASVTGCDEEDTGDDVPASAAVSSPDHSNNDRLLTELSSDYSKYLNINVKGEKALLEEHIEEMLMKLDEYCGLVDLIRSDTTQCLGRTVPAIQEKTADIHKVFDRIEQLEMFVKMVGENVNHMEKLVEEAEKEMSSLKSIKKLFSGISMPSFLSPKKQAIPEPRKAKFQPPDIYKTDELLHYEQVPTTEMLPSSASSSGAQGHHKDSASQHRGLLEPDDAHTLQLSNTSHENNDWIAKTSYEQIE